jgi:hypothetical protein
MISGSVTYGWGMIPVQVQIGPTRVGDGLVAQKRPLHRAHQSEYPQGGETERRRYRVRPAGSAVRRYEYGYGQVPCRVEAAAREGGCCRAVCPSPVLRLRETNTCFRRLKNPGLQGRPPSFTIGSNAVITIRRGRATPAGRGPEPDRICRANRATRSSSGAFPSSPRAHPAHPPPPTGHPKGGG